MTKPSEFPSVKAARKIVEKQAEYYQQMMQADESHLPVEQQSLVFRLHKRAEIRRQIKDRKSVQEGRADRIADLLEEAAQEIERLTKEVASLEGVIEQMNIDAAGEDW